MSKPNVNPIDALRQNSAGSDEPKQTPEQRQAKQRKRWSPVEGADEFVGTALTFRLVHKADAPATRRVEVERPNSHYGTVALDELADYADAGAAIGATLASLPPVK